MQFYTIGILIDCHMIPIVYALLPCKTEVVYAMLFEALRDSVPGDWSPNTIILDYEAAAMNALKLTFPHSQISGCMFHLGQSIHRLQTKKVVNVVNDTTFLGLSDTTFPT